MNYTPQPATVSLVQACHAESVVHDKQSEYVSARQRSSQLVHGDMICFLLQLLLQQYPAQSTGEGQTTRYLNNTLRNLQGKVRRGGT